MTDDEIIAINRDTFFATDDTAAHWLAFGRAIERRTLEMAAQCAAEWGAPEFICDHIRALGAK